MVHTRVGLPCEREVVAPLGPLSGSSRRFLDPRLTPANLDDNAQGASQLRHHLLDSREQVSAHTGPEA